MSSVPKQDYQLHVLPFLKKIHSINRRTKITIGSVQQNIVIKTMLTNTP